MFWLVCARHVVMWLIVFVKVTETDRTMQQG